MRGAVGNDVCVAVPILIPPSFKMLHWTDVVHMFSKGAGLSSSIASVERSLFRRLTEPVAVRISACRGDTPQHNLFSRGSNRPVHKWSDLPFVEKFLHCAYDARSRIFGILHDLNDGCAILANIYLDTP